MIKRAAHSLETIVRHIPARKVSSKDVSPKRLKRPASLVSLTVSTTGPRYSCEMWRSKSIEPRLPFIRNPSSWRPVVCSGCLSTYPRRVMKYTSSWLAPNTKWKGRKEYIKGGIHLCRRLQQEKRRKWRRNDERKPRPLGNKSLNCISRMVVEWAPLDTHSTTWVDIIIVVMQAMKSEEVGSSIVFRIHSFRPAGARWY